MAIYKVVNESAEDSTNYLEEACDYLNGCFEGSYEIDEELLEACVDAVNENTDTLTVDDYNTMMESVEYLQEISDPKKQYKIDETDRKIDKLKAKLANKEAKYAAKLDYKSAKKEEKLDKDEESGKISSSKYEKLANKLDKWYSPREANIKHKFSKLRRKINKAEAKRDYLEDKYFGKTEKVKQSK